MSMILGYKRIRGLAQPIRYVLEYAGQPYEEKFYKICWDEKNKKWDESEWFDIKYQIGLPFSNLPYLIDGDLKLTQSNAILSHLGRKFDLMGKTEEEKAWNDMMMIITYEMHWDYVVLVYRDWNNKTKKDDFMMKLPTKLKQVSDFLGEKTWLTGDNITVSDFHLYEVLQSLVDLVPTCLEGMDNLMAFSVRFEELPAIAAYMKSDRIIRKPFNNYYAHWANTPEDE